jgi:hypothetical protein
MIAGSCNYHLETTSKTLGSADGRARRAEEASAILTSLRQISSSLPRCMGKPTRNEDLAEYYLRAAV